MRSYGRSVKAAARGLLYAFSHEANFRTEVVIALSVVLLIFVLDIPWQHAVVLLFLILVVLVLEIVNTVVERVVDILKPRIHPYARIIKDLMAAALRQ